MTEALRLALLPHTYEIATFAVWQTQKKHWQSDFLHLIAHIYVLYKHKTNAQRIGGLVAYAIFLIAPGIITVKKKIKHQYHQR